MDIIAQIKVSLSQGNRHVDTVVLVQKDAPNNLLLGTDIQPHLVFALMMERPDGKKTDLLSGQGEVLYKSPKMLSLPKSAGHCVETPTPVLESQVLSKTPGPEADGEVHLLQAVKVPAGHQKLVRGRIDRDIDEELLLFTPQGSQIV